MPTLKRKQKQREQATATPKVARPAASFHMVTRPNPRADTPSFHQMIERLDARHQWLQDNLGDDPSFMDYVSRHPRMPLVESKMAEEVRLHHAVLANWVVEGKIPQESTTMQKYLALAADHQVDPSYVFPELPSVAQLCELDPISDWTLPEDPEKEGDEGRSNLIKREVEHAWEYFQNRWQILTQTPLRSTISPSTLSGMMAPVPYSLSWSEQLYDSESRSMGHQQPSNATMDVDRDSNERNVESRHTGGTERSIAESMVEQPAKVNESDQHNRNVDDSDCVDCGMDEIFRLAGGRASTRSDSGSPSYTFPGNSLRWGEDIFYDYAVMVPVNQCDVNADAGGQENRSLASVRLAAQFACGLLDFLDSQNLSAALGPGVVQKLKEDLDMVAKLQEGAAAGEIRRLIKVLKEQACLCRSISRMRILFTPITANPFQTIVALDQALSDFPDFYTVTRSVASENERGENRPTLQLIDSSATENANTYPDIAQGGNHLPQNAFGAPEAQLGDEEGIFKSSYGTETMHKMLRRYIEYLGGTFYWKMTNLRSTARAISSEVNAFMSSPRSDQSKPEDVLSEFVRLAEGVTQDVLSALAQILEDIAEQLPLPSTTKAEGSKRLAIMIVFRQYWFPEGYVAGKLVGYKNLIPNQKEVVKRRTFVKTTRETSTVQEFAAAREEDFSRSSKETAELIKEASSQFDFSMSTKGSFDLWIVGGDVETDFGTKWQNTSKSTQSRILEATAKSAMKYNEKREVKIREMTEVEDVQETTSELHNLNREITANYFYYQLYRQYYVTTELAHIQPVLLRTRDVPNPAAVDDKFLSDYAHILINALPRQLSADLQETVGEVTLQGRTMVRRRSDSDLKRAGFEEFQRSPMPSDAEGQSRWGQRLESLERAASEAQTALIDAEENYIRTRTRLNRVIAHVRENICYYMQFIWHGSPTVDQDWLLQESAEDFAGQPLASVTRGFARLGYYGNEEIFEYTGQSLGCVENMMKLLVAGYQIVDSLSDTDLRQHPLFLRLKRFFPADTDEMIIERIRSQVFIRDWLSPGELFNGRRIQVAQDALVVETLPGQVPLLEGFQMAHRILDVQRVCLENKHLDARIADKPWVEHGEDSYRVYRREGEPLPVREEEP